MSTQILYGKPCAERIGEEVIKLVKEQKTCKLCTIGFRDEKWEQYTRSLEKSAVKYGVLCENIVVDNDISSVDFFNTVEKVCRRPDVCGVMLQQPLPKGYINAVNYISLDKDVDCLNPLSIAKMYNGESGFRPATPTAVLALLDFYNIDLCGRNLVIVGRGNAVGKPLALMALARNATVTVCHTKTRNLASVCRNADIIISACGVAGLVTRDFVTSDSIVIDVGLSFVNGASCGDISPDVYNMCKAYSPVPGGVGPITRASLFLNLLKSKTI